MCPLAVSRGYDERAKGTGGCISQALESLYISLGEGGSCATRRYGAVTLVSGVEVGGRERWQRWCWANTRSKRDEGFRKR